FLRKGEPTHSGTYALGSIRMRQNLASWHGGHEQRMRLLRRHIHNVVEDIRREMPLREARHFIALGGDVRFAGAQVAGEEESDGIRTIGREVFLAFCDQVAGNDVESLVERYRLPQADAETLVPALLAYRELLVETGAERILVPNASLRAGLLLDVTGTEEYGIQHFRKQVLASAAPLGEKSRYDAPPAPNIPQLA